MKYSFVSYCLLFLSALFLPASTHSQVPSKTLTIGPPTNDNKTLRFNRSSNKPLIRWNESESKLQFTNDGSIFKDIGSGAGGGGAGVNLLAEFNFDFESGSGDWTASGGTFSINTASPLFGEGSGALGQYLRSESVTIARGMIGRTCAATVNYSYGGASDDYQIEMIQNGSSTIAEFGVISTAPGTATKGVINYDCPSSDTDALAFQVISAVSNPEIIKIDNVFFGSDTNAVDVSQSVLIGEARFPATASCTWARSATSQGAFGTTAACPGPTVVSNPGPGIIQTTDADLPQITINNLPAGTYEISVGGHSNSSSADFAALSLYDGTTRSGRIGVGSTTSMSSFRVVGVFSYSSSGNRTFALHGAAASGTVTISAAQATQENDLHWVVRRYPSSSAEGLTFETSGWKVDANIGGANPSLGASNQTSYVSVEDAGLDLVNNPGVGNIAAQIPCSSTNPPTGLTCSAGNESVGISFYVPVGGDVLACASFAHEVTTVATGSVNTVFQLVETLSNAQTILQEGNSRIGSGNRVPSTVVNNAHRVCGVFSFPTAGQRTLRLMYEQTITATISANLVLGDRSTSLGQRDIHFEVYPINQQMPAPVFAELQNLVKSGVSGTKVGAGGINCAASPTIVQNDQDMIDSVSRTGTGDCTINFSAGYWTSAPICTVISTNAGSAIINTLQAAPTTASARNISRTDAGAVTDQTHYWTCIGQ
jgi:hypothetical protein